MQSPETNFQHETLKTRVWYIHHDIWHFPWFKKQAINISWDGQKSEVLHNDESPPTMIKRDKQGLNICVWWHCSCVFAVDCDLHRTQDICQHLIITSISRHSKMKKMASDNLLMYYVKMYRCHKTSLTTKFKKPKKKWFAASGPWESYGAICWYVILSVIKYY